MPFHPSTSALARDREAKAGNLEAAIVAFGVAWHEYREATHALESTVNVELTRALEIPLILHLARAGLGELLERKLVGTPASLRALVEQQHTRTPAIERAR